MRTKALGANVGAGRFGLPLRERQAEAQHQASARGRSGLQEAAPGESVRRGLLDSERRGSGCAVIDDHDLPPCQLAAACLIASRMRT